MVSLTTIGIGLALVLGLFVLAWFVTQSREVSVTFVLTLFAAGLLVVEFLVPSGIVDRLPVPAVLGQLNAVTVAIEVGIVVVVWWVVESRFIKNRSKPETVARDVRRNAESLADTYANIGRIAFATGVSIVFIALSVGGDLVGEVGQMLAQAPLVGSNLTIIGGGWLALGGSLPVIGALSFDVTPRLFAGVTLVVFFLALAVKEAR